MKSSMFERYGGFSTIHRVVLAFYDKMLDSELVASHFEDVDMAGLVDHQTKFISQVMGGPASYSNEVLEQVHARLGVQEAAFDEMTHLLEMTLHEFDFKDDDIQAVMKEIKNRKPFIVVR